MKRWLILLLFAAGCTQLRAVVPKILPIPAPEPAPAVDCSQFNTPTSVCYSCTALGCGHGVASEIARQEMAASAAALPPVPPPMSVSYEDVAVARDSSDGWLRFGGPDGHTLNVPERDIRQNFMIFRALPQALMLARTVPTCDAVVRRVIDEYYVIEKTGINNYPYRANSSEGWHVGPTGSTYDKDRRGLRDIRACLVEREGVVCGQSPRLTAGMLMLLNLTLTSDHRCTLGPMQKLPHEAYDPTRAEEGLIKPSTRVPPPNALQLQLLDNCVAAHGASKDVTSACAAFVASALTLEQQRIFMLAPFSGENGGWVGDSFAAIKSLTHVNFIKWASDIRRIPLGQIGMVWRDIWRHNMDHGQAHLCENVGPGTGFEVLLSIDGKGAGGWYYESCEEVIKRVGGGHPEPHPTVVVGTPKPGSTPKPGATSQPGLVTGDFTFYAMLASGGSMKAPKTSTEPPIAVEVESLTPYPVGSQRVPTGADAARMQSAIEAYLGVPISAIRWASRVGP